MNESHIDEMVDAYVECALWAGTYCPEDDPDESIPLDADFTSDDLSEEALGEIRAECEEFVRYNLSDLGILVADQVGHDFYLTRNHHGAGFWDRGLGQVGERLTKAAHAYGTSELYPGDDGILYVGG